MSDEGACRCPLCHESADIVTSDSLRREIFHCSCCDLHFVHPRHFLGSDQERQRYELHDNAADNIGYLTYLGDLAKQLHRIPLTDPLVLDFGSGKEAVLTRILSQRGFRCTAYDPLYGIGLTALHGRYDIVVACEVLEHLRDPAAEISALERVLEPGGYCLVKTMFVTSRTDFSRWWYAGDATHIQFFSLKTCAYIATVLRRTILWHDTTSIVIFGPPSS